MSFGGGRLVCRLHLHGVVWHVLLFAPVGCCTVKWSSSGAAGVAGRSAAGAPAADFVGLVISVVVSVAFCVFFKLGSVIGLVSF